MRIDIVHKHENQENKMSTFNVDYFRSLFPYLRAGKSVCLDAVGGTQVPDSVIEAITDHLTYRNGNKGGVFPRSVETDNMMDEAREIIKEFLNAREAAEIVFGGSSTTLAFSVSRSLGITWHPGDEIVVSRLDHDANVSPWVQTAEREGVKVKHFDIDDECQLGEEDLIKVLSNRTRLVAFCAASSSVGTRTKVKRLTEIAKAAGALVFIDAVAYAPHFPIDVQDWGCDFVTCSAYKFFGPHQAFLWGKREHLESLQAFKIQSAPSELPLKWLNGAQPYELIAGLKAAIEYIAHVGEMHPCHRSLFPAFSGRQLDIHAGMAAIESYETGLTWELIKAVKARPRYKIWGISDPERKSERIPTIAISLGAERSNDIARHLAERGIDLWSRSVYSRSLNERLGLEKTGEGGFIRVGLIHYNTSEEVGRFLEALDAYKPEI